MQDVLVVTAPGSGAEVIPFLKTYVNLPMAIGFTVLYAKVTLSSLYSASLPSSRVRLGSCLPARQPYLNLSYLACHACASILSIMNSIHSLKTSSSDYL